MTGLDRSELRALVREVVRDAVAGMNAQAAPVKSAPSLPAPVATPTVADQFGVAATGPLAANEKSRSETIRLAGDQDLDAFVRKLLRLFENPKTRADLKAGRLSFRLAGSSRSSATHAATHRIESGAVTERHIVDITAGSAPGGTLILGPRAVLTPLAREKARILGLSIQKERR